MKIKEELASVLATFAKNNPNGCLKNPDAYAQWLAQTYFFVRYSVPMLAFAIPHLKDEELKLRFGGHMGEEDRHDMLALKDLKRLGRDISEFQEWDLTQAFYHSQFFRIQFEGATSVLGYILFLEALASHWAKDEYEILKDLYPQSTLFLKVHAEEDPSHVDHAIAAISKLSAAEQEVILKNMHYTHEIYQRMINRMCESKQNKKAA